MAGTHLPSREVSSSLQEGRHSPSPWGRKQSISGRQASRQVLSFPLGKEAIHCRQAVRQALSFPLGKEAVFPRQLLTFLSGKEAVSPRQLLTFLPGKEAILPWQLLTFLLGKEAILCQQLLTFLPGKEAVPPRLLFIFPLGKQAVLPRQLPIFPLGKVTVLPSQPPILPWGKEVAILKQVKQAIKLGQAYRVLGILLGIGHPRLPRRTVLPPRQTVLTPEKATPPLPSPIAFPKGLLMKNLTLSGSLTYPANLWPQLKGLFLLKNPTLQFPPGNLLT